MITPGRLAAYAFHRLRQLRRPYAVEVIGDPYDAFATGASQHPARQLIRWWWSRQLREQCQNAAAAIYVTQEFLQSRYPCPKIREVASDVILPADAFASVARLHPGDRTHRIINVATFQQPYKGQDVLVDAFAKCTYRGIDAQLTFIGDGPFRASVEDRVRQLGLADRVQFLGFVASPQSVRTALDEADLFVLPSRTEGLPRALLEAMARGLPCLASNVGGIPELLVPEDMVPPDNADQLASKMEAVLVLPTRFNDMSRRNLNRAKAYAESQLLPRRVAFYERIRRITEQSWSS